MPEAESSAGREVAEQKEFFEDDAPRLATRFFGNPDYPRNMRKKLTFAAKRLSGCKNVLEIGAGRGLQLTYFLERMPDDCRYTGIDLAFGALRVATGRLAAGLSDRVSLINSCAEELPFRAGSFDGVFCLDALHHVTSQGDVLRELRRVLSPGAPIICIEPNPRYPVNLVYRRDPIEKKLFELTEARAAKWGRHAGLVDVTVDHLPVYFPSFPAALESVYGTLEDILAAIPPLRSLSTTRVLFARVPDSHDS